MTELGFTKKFDKDISSIIASYYIEKPIKFKDYILNNFEHLCNENILYLNHICANGEKMYIDYLYDNHMELIKWNYLCQNKHAIHILKINKDKLKIDLVKNKHPDAIELLHELLNNGYILTNFECNYLCTYANMDTISMLQNSPYFVMSWIYLSKNPQVLDMLMSNPGAINWLNFLTLPSNDKIVKFIEKNLHIISNDAIYMLSRRTDTIHILEKYPHLINWTILSSNPESKAIDILEKNINKIVWFCFSGNLNPRVIDIMEKNLDKIVWKSVLCYENDKVIDFVNKYEDIILNKVDIKIISSSYNAINIIEKNIDKVDWKKLCYNTHPKAIEILENNIEKVNWAYLTYNNKALSLKNKHLDKLITIGEKELMFEIDQNKYDNLIKAYTKIIYNM